jgi:hypothetical protein
VEEQDISETGEVFGRAGLEAQVWRLDQLAENGLIESSLPH